MTFAELKQESREILFPEGEGENVVAAHDRFFNDALYDLCKNVVCLQQAQVNVFPQCGSYFNCGMTVLPAPHGRILKVYTIGKLASTVPAVVVPATIPVSTIANGTVIGAVTLPMVAIFNPPVVDQQICAITEAATYSIKVEKVPAGSSDSSFYPANSPQYYRTTISYIDAAGLAQTIQPSLDCHVSDATNSGTLSAEIGAGTNITATITPYNVPFVDGGVVMRVTVTKTGSLTTPGTVILPASVPGAADDWCSKVFYDQVEYCHIEQYVKLSRYCGTPNSIFASALISNMFGCGPWRNKYRYPCPTDTGFSSLPPLPQGFHYPQASTDAGGRSRGGVWALYRGRIYIAPWIESDETVVVEWNGIKDKWSNSDLVEDDSKFRQAVRLNVAVQHFTHYEQDQQKLIVLETQWREALRDLIHECREQNRIRSCNEAGGSGSEARGIGSSDNVTPKFYNEELPAVTVSCPAGQTGTPVTVPISAGIVGSMISVSDANATAHQNALNEATGRLSCTATPTVFQSSVPKIGHASCPGASGDTPAASGSEVSLTYNGIWTSTDPINGQALADEAAQDEADRLAGLQLVCTFHNKLAHGTASCPTGETGSDTTYDIQPNTEDYDVTVDHAGVASVAAGAQAQSNAGALAAANTAAQGLLSCTGIIVTVGNQEKTFPMSQVFNCPQGSISPMTRTVNVMGICPAGHFTKVTTLANQVEDQLDVNNQAIIYAQQNALLLMNSALAQWSSFCRRNYITIG